MSVQISPGLREMFAYLFALQESGRINMLESGSYLIDEFGISGKEAKAVLLDWMKNYATYKEMFRK